MVLATTSVPASAGEPIFGFNENGFQYYETGTHSAAQIARLEAAAGADVQRFVVSWARVQAEGLGGDALRSNWDLYDAAIAAMRAEGVRPLITIEAAPDWATGHDCVGRTCPPAAGHLDDWYAFAAAVAKRYPDAVAIEIWSEPNWKGRWTTLAGPDPKRYARLYETAARAIHAANSNMRVLIGGVTYWHKKDVLWGNMTITTFLTRFYESLDKSVLWPRDGLSVHAYPWVTEWDSLDGQFATTLRQARKVRNAADPGRKLWITEVGVTTSVPYGDKTATEGDQARTLINVLDKAARMNDVAAVLIHTLIEPPPSSHEPSEEGFGVVKANLVPKKAYCRLARRAGRPAPTGCASPLPPPPPILPPAPDAPCTIRGTPGPDILVGGPGSDVICGRGGNDQILGRGGADLIRGGAGRDWLSGGKGPDHIRGGRGHDILRGGPGHDILRGGRGRDILRGGPGRDTLRGGAGRDVKRP